MRKNILQYIKKMKTKEFTMQRRLVLFFVALTFFLIISFTALLILFGITKKGTASVNNYFNDKLNDIAKTVSNDFSQISVQGINLAEEISDSCDNFFSANNISARTLENNRNLIEPLLSSQAQSLINIVKNTSCGGAFIMLDSSLTKHSNDTEYYKSGIFIKKTQPTYTQSVGVKLHYLRGPASIARENNIGLLGQWQMEFNISGQDYFDYVMNTARNNPDLPLSRLYYWTECVTLKGNSESGYLLCVPLRSYNGTVFGLCGIEISDRMFKSLYSPNSDTYDNMFSVVATYDSKKIYCSKSAIAGNSYLTGIRNSKDFLRLYVKDGFERFSSSTNRYAGKSLDLNLYADNSPYKNEKWCLALLLPETIIDEIFKEIPAHISIIVFIILIISIIISLFIGRRYLRQINEAFDLYEESFKKLNEEKETAKNNLSMAQTMITHISDEKIPEIDKDDLDRFMECLNTLTPKETFIFNLYLEGKSTNEVLETANINQNTLKYHNRNIYSKLGVSSKKQLLEYATLIKYIK